MKKPLERQLGFWETVRQNTHLKQFGTSQIAIVAKIKGPLTGSIIEKSLRFLFEQQPLLRARIVKKNNAYLFEIDRDFADIPFKVIERRAEGLWKKIIEQELSFPPPTHKYMWKAIFIHGNEGEAGQHELLLFFHHAIADGHSACHAIKNVLKYCEQYAEGIVPSMSPLPLYDCVEKMLQKPLSWDDYAHQLQNYHPIPQEENWHYVSYEPVGQRVTSSYFVKASYQRLQEQCRKEGVSINSAIAAGLIYCGTKKKIHKGPISILSLVDLRKYCKPALTSDYLGCYVTGILTKHVLKDLNPSAFWNLAREYQSEFYESITKVGFTPYEFLPKKVKKFSISDPSGVLAEQQNIKNEGTYSVDFCLTNKGVIDIPQKYGSLDLEQLYLSTSRQAGAIACIVSVVSFPETMFFSFSYADPLLNKDIIKELVDILFHVLDLAPQ